MNVVQLSAREFHGFGTLIANELDVQQPDPLLTIIADINVEDSFILLENEKLYVDAEVFAGVMANAHHGVILTENEWSD